MQSRLLKYLIGWLLWKHIKYKEKIDYKTIVLVLTGENQKVDEYCLMYLKDFMKRKYANKVIIMCDRIRSKTVINKTAEIEELRIIHFDKRDIELLYFLYCFTKFFDNIVFTYTDTPRDNLLGKYLKETDVNAEDAVCLALYHLRYVPE